MGYDMICVRNEKRTFRAPQVSTATIAKTKNPVIDKNDCLQIHLTNGIERMIHISFIDVPGRLPRRQVAFNLIKKHR